MYLALPTTGDLSRQGYFESPSRQTDGHTHRERERKKERERERERERNRSSNLLASSPKRFARVASDDEAGAERYLKKTSQPSLPQEAVVIPFADEVHQLLEHPVCVVLNVVLIAQQSDLSQCKEI